MNAKRFLATLGSILLGATAPAGAADHSTGDPAEAAGKPLGDPAEAAGVAVGDPAPDFTLAASDGNTYTLSDFRGRQAVVIAWYPKAYTRGCTIECKSLAAHGDLIRAFDVRYFMASVDPLDDVSGFAKQQKADFPLLSDADKRVAKAYGVLRPPGYAARETFYVGKDGRILAIDRDVKPETAAQDMAARLAELGVAKAEPKPEDGSAP